MKPWMTGADVLTALRIPVAVVFPFLRHPAGQLGAVAVAAASDFFANGTQNSVSDASPVLTSWLTKNSALQARVISGWDPSSGPLNTWPSSNPAANTATNNRCQVLDGRTTSTLLMSRRRTKHPYRGRIATTSANSKE